MKLFLLLLSSLAPCAMALAQPDPLARGMGTNPPEARIVPQANTPENGVRKFVADLDGNLELGLAADVVGARVGFYGGDDWEWAFNNIYTLRSVKNLKIDDIKVENQTEDEATVSLSFHQERGNGDEVRRTEPQTVTLQLRHSTEVSAPAFLLLKAAWRVVPPSPEDVLAHPLSETPPLELAAFLTLRDPRLLPFIEEQRGLTQLKQMWLGALMFVQDYDGFFAFDDAAHERALRPYIKDDALYTIAGTNEKWHFNDNLSATGRRKIKDTAHTVLFYDGTAPQSDKLNFRFSNKTLIGFADGHCAALAKDAADALIWKP